MRRVISFCLAILLLAGNSFAADENKIESKEFGFSATFPTEPGEQSKDGPLKTKIKMFLAQDGQNASVIAVTDLPIPANEPDKLIQQRLEGAVEQSVRGMKGKLTSKEKITRNDVPGREFTADVGKLKVRSLVLLRNKRLWQVMVLGPKTFTDGEKAGAFLKSFEIAKPAEQPKK